MTPVRLEPEAPQSRVKHSTTEPGIVVEQEVFCKNYIVVVSLNRLFIEMDRMRYQLESGVVNTRDVQI